MHEGAGVILEFCRSRRNPPRESIFKSNFEVAINSLALDFLEFEGRAQRAIQGHQENVHSSGCLSNTHLQSTKRAFCLGAPTKWLAEVICQGSERSICESSLSKAKRRVAELEIKDTRTPLRHTSGLKIAELILEMTRHSAIFPWGSLQYPDRPENLFPEALVAFRHTVAGVTLINQTFLQNQGSVPLHEWFLCCDHILMPDKT